MWTSKVWRRTNLKALAVVECGTSRALASLSGEWDALLNRASGASVFSGWEWVESAWLHATPGRRPFVLLAREGGPQGRLVGVLPLESTTRLGLVRTIEVAGCSRTGYPWGDYGGLVAEKGREREVWIAMLRHLRRSPWVTLDLRNCMSGEDGVPPPAYTSLPRGTGWGVSVRRVDTCRRIPLAGTFDDYLASLTPNSRQNIRRKLRKLEAAGITVEEVDAADDTARAAALETLFALHQSHWVDDASGGAFPDETSRAMHRHMAYLSAQKGGLDLRIARSPEGEAIGVIYNFVKDGVGYFYQLGLSSDDRWAAYSLGVCLLASSIRGAIERGCHTFDLLRGDHAYKSHFGGYTTQNLRVTVYRLRWLPGLVALAKAARGKLRKAPAQHAEVRRPASTPPAIVQKGA